MRKTLCSKGRFEFGTERIDATTVVLESLPPQNPVVDDYGDVHGSRLGEWRGSATLYRSPDEDWTSRARLVLEDGSGGDVAMRVMSIDTEGKATVDFVGHGLPPKPLRF